MKTNTFCKLLLFLLFLLGSWKLSYTSNDNYLFGGRAAGMGNAAVSLYDFWSISHNQAGLSKVENISAGFYFENRFLIPELSFGAGAFAFPTDHGILGFSFTHFGYALYSENKVGVSYARGFGDRLSLGMQLNYHHTRIDMDYGSAGTVSFEIGAIYEILPGLHLGVHLFNPTRSQIAEYADERIPTILRGGFSYQFSDKVIVALETEKDVDQETVFKAGIDYKVVDNFSLRAGVGSNPASNSFGFGMQLGQLQIDLASSYHYVLGYSPQISMVYQFK